MLDEWLMRQIALRNFGAIYTQVARDNSLCMFRGTIADAIYKEIDDPGGDREFCLSTLRAMLDRGWQWSNTRKDIHRLLPLHCQLERLGVPGAERKRYYDSATCVTAASTWGSDMTVNDFQALLRSGRRSSVPLGL